MKKRMIKTPRRAHTRKQYSLYRNQGVLAATICIWIGIVIALLVFRSSDSIVHLLTTDNASVQSAFSLQSILSTSVWWLANLCLLFLCGLCAFGCPLIVLDLIIVGFRFGFEQCRSLQSQGIWSTICCVSIPCMFYGVVFVGSGYRCMRLSVDLTKCVLRRQTRMNNALIHSVVWLLLGGVVVLAVAAFQVGCT